MELRKYFTFLLIAVNFFNFCCRKRYEEGPLISLRTPEYRIVGNWVPEKTFVNDIDKTNEIDSIKLSYKFEILTQNVHNILINSANNTKSMRWGFKNHKNEFYVISNFPCNYYLNFNPPTLGYILCNESWKILRLTNKELWLEMNARGNKYQTRFKRGKQTS